MSGWTSGPPLAALGDGRRPAPPRGRRARRFWHREAGADRRSYLASLHAVMTQRPERAVPSAFFILACCIVMM
jgi:hypothetical protein